MNIFSGYRTYLIAIAGLIYAGLGFFMFHMTGVDALQLVQVSLIGMGLRAAI